MGISFRRKRWQVVQLLETFKSAPLRSWEFYDYNQARTAKSGGILSFVNSTLSDPQITYRRIPRKQGLSPGLIWLAQTGYNFIQYIKNNYPDPVDDDLLNRQSDLAGNLTMKKDKKVI